MKYLTLSAIFSKAPVLQPTMEDSIRVSKPINASTVSWTLVFILVYLPGDIHCKISETVELSNVRGSLALGNLAVPDTPVKVKGHGRTYDKNT